jgi:hypothetical protein
MRRFLFACFLLGCADRPIGETETACIMYWRYGVEMHSCGAVCTNHGDCTSGCCYPTDDANACVDSYFCDHARANGHDI